MTRLSIVLCLTAAFTLSCISSAQEASRDASPTLKPCNQKNPPPCIEKPPEVIHWIDAEYSVVAHNNKIKGTVVLWTIIGTDGLAHDIKVVRSLGYGLDELAVEALKKWTFKPATSGGKAAPAQINVEMPFRYR